MVQQEFRSQLVYADVTKGADVTVPAGEYTCIAEKKITAQTAYAFGLGAIVNGVDDRGTIKVVANDTSGAIGDMVRIQVNNAEKNRPVIVMEDSVTNFTAGIKLSRGGFQERGGGAVFAGEDSYLQVMLYCAADKTFDHNAAGNIANIAVTKQIL